MLEPAALFANGKFHREEAPSWEKGLSCNSVTIILRLLIIIAGFADDVDIMATSLRGLNEGYKAIKEAAERMGFLVCRKKVNIW